MECPSLHPWLIMRRSAQIPHEGSILDHGQRQSTVEETLRHRSALRHTLSTHRAITRHPLACVRLPLAQIARYLQMTSTGILQHHAIDQSRMRITQATDRTITICRRLCLQRKADAMLVVHRMSSILVCDAFRQLHHHWPGDPRQLNTPVTLTAPQRLGGKAVL